MNGLVIESYITQHHVLANLNKTSVNTIRMWLVQHKGEIKLVGAILRIGKKNAVVDNYSQGGTLCLIDPEQGSITTGMTYGIVPTYYDVHPDSGVQLKGLQLPF